MTGKRILIVEDEVLIAISLEAALSDGGLTPVGPFSRVDKAVAAAETEALDAAVLDVNLAGAKVFPVADAHGSAAARISRDDDPGQAVPGAPDRRLHSQAAKVTRAASSCVSFSRNGCAAGGKSRSSVRQAQHPAGVGGVDPLRRCDLADRGMDARLQHAPPAVCPCQRLSG